MIVLMGGVHLRADAGRESSGGKRGTIGAGQPEYLLRISNERGEFVGHEKGVPLQLARFLT